MNQAAEIPAWLAEFDSPKRRRTWQKSWDRSGITAMREAIARGDCYNPNDLEYTPPPYNPDE